MEAFENPQICNPLEGCCGQECPRAGKIVGYFLIPRKYSSNQSARLGKSSFMSFQPCPWPSLTINLAVTPASLQRLTNDSACWIGTSLSASPWMISVGGV